MEWALMTIVKQHLEEYLEGLETNFDTSRTPLTLRHVRMKEDKMQRDVFKEGKSPFVFQSGTIGSIEFHMSWLGHLQVYATDMVLNLQVNPVKALSEAVTSTARPKVIDPQNAIDLAQPRYCKAHAPVECRHKVAERWSECKSCQIRLQTNYAELSLCPICSERERRCMLCGNHATSAPDVTTVGSSTMQPPFPGGSAHAYDPRSNALGYGSGPHGSVAPASPSGSVFSWNSGFTSASSLLSSYLRRPGGDSTMAHQKVRNGDKVTIRGLPQKFENFNGATGTVNKVDDGGMCLVYLDNLQLGPREVTVPVDNLHLWGDPSRQGMANSWRPQMGQIPEAHDDGSGVAAEASLSAPSTVKKRAGASGTRATNARNVRVSGMVGSSPASMIPQTPVRVMAPTPSGPGRGFPLTTPPSAPPRDTEATNMSWSPNGAIQPAPQREHFDPRFPHQGVVEPPVVGSSQAGVGPSQVGRPRGGSGSVQPKANVLVTPRSEVDDSMHGGQQWMRDTSTPAIVDHRQGGPMHEAPHFRQDEQGVVDQHDARMDHIHQQRGDTRRHDLRVGHGYQHDAVIPDSPEHRVRVSGSTESHVYEPVSTPPMTQSASDRDRSNVHFRMDSRGGDRLSTFEPDQHRQDFELAMRMDREEQEAAESGQQDQGYGFTPQSSPGTSGGSKKHNPFDLNNHW